MSITILKPVPSIVVGVNSKFFSTPNLNQEHLIFLIKDLLSSDFPDYKINCYIDHNLESKYLFDIHNAHILLEVSAIKKNDHSVGNVYFPQLEENLIECLEDFEFRLTESIYPEFINSINLSITNEEISKAVTETIDYCSLHNRLQIKVKSFNTALENSKYDFSGFSFFLNYADQFEFFLMDYKNNIIGLFSPDVNRSLIEVWIETIGELRNTARTLGYNYIKEQSNLIKNQFETFITPSISDDYLLDTNDHQIALDLADKTIRKADDFNEIIKMQHSMFLVFRESFSDGVAERCYDLAYSTENN